MSEWKECTIGDIGRIVTGKTPRTAIAENYGGGIPFLSPSDNMEVKYVTFTNKTLTQQGVSEVKNCLLPKNAICVSCIGSDLGKVLVTTQPTVTNQQINSIIVNSDNDVNFVYYLMTLVGRELNYISKTSTAVPIINKSTFSNYKIVVPSLEHQRKIAAILSSLDDKIETNRRINARLEELAQALFKSWFIDFEPFGGVIPENWENKSLSDIAIYTNGLAMQKYPPLDDNDRLPVLKIKELGEGHVSQNSDYCSKSNIGKPYIVNDGDVIFFWSGTLLVKIWVGGICGLNQHLFKVTSDKYPKWFYFYWTLYHNENFKRIAKDKAVTMGHIKRVELDKAQVVVPSSQQLSEFTTVFSPIFDKIISIQKESARLAALRDALLPKLMSGELKPE